MQQFEALGRSGVNDIGGKIETFPKPGLVNYVKLRSSEFTSLCPITGQPDFYEVSVEYVPDRVCAESKSVKLYFQSFRQKGEFVEQLAETILLHFREALDPLSISVDLIQVPRGGIEITAQAHWKRGE